MLVGSLLLAVNGLPTSGLSKRELIRLVGESSRPLTLRMQSPAAAAHTSNARSPLWRLYWDEAADDAFAAEESARGSRAELFGDINRAYRDGSRSEIAKWRPVVWHICAAKRRLASVPGVYVPICHQSPPQLVLCTCVGSAP